MRAASRARAASTIFEQMIFASSGCSSRNSESFADTTSCTIGCTSEDTSLSLVCDENLGSGTLHRQHAAQALAHVVAGGLDLRLLRDLFLLDVAVERARHRLPQAGQVRAAVALRRSSAEHCTLSGVRVVPLHCNFDDDAVLFRLHRMEIFGCSFSFSLFMYSTKPLTPPE